MFFQSYIFIFVFLPVCVGGYWLLNKLGRHRPGLVWLLCCSLFFYGYMAPRLLPGIAASALANFLLGRGLQKAQGHRKALLAVAICINIGALVYCKYTNFIIENINLIFGGGFNVINLILPLGISFFTFQQVAYLVDAYRGEAPEYKLLDYCLFVCFFPYVTSGPIAFHHEIIPQFNDAGLKKFDPNRFAMGLTAFSIGLFKKVIVADTFGAAADLGFGIVNGVNSTTAFVIMLSYTFQLYFDFSGYSDMARGIGYMLGIRLPRNFDSPYKALTIAEFWEGWHMTMTRFFTRYIYIPLGGSRKGTVRTCLNTAAVFLISGLWHGANWTFVVWGAMHGVALIANRLFKKQVEGLHAALSWALTFGFVNVAWIFFRSESLGLALSFCKGLARFDLGDVAGRITACFRLPELALFQGLLGMEDARFNLMLCIGFLALALTLCVQGRNVDERLEHFRPTAKSAAICALAAFWAIVSLSGVSTFLYSNF